MALSKYHDEYLKADEYAIFHLEDSDLPTVKIKLPTLESFYDLPYDEALQQVTGYGMAPKDQHVENYRKIGLFSMPDKLVDIEEQVRAAGSKKKASSDKVSVQEIFDYIESDPVGFEEEIRWMDEQHLRAEHGHWLFIKGKPTYIDGVHYAYLLCWRIYNNKRRDSAPFYRDVDRKIFLFFRWAYTTKTAYFKYVLNYKDHFGKWQCNFYNSKKTAEEFARKEGYTYIVDEYDDYVEMPNRTVFGVVFPKRRRIGGTTQASFFLLMITLRRQFGGFAIQALTEETATEDVYHKKILEPYKRMWFFFKPAQNIHDSNSLKFVTSKNDLLSKGIEPHGGWVAPRSSANRAFDGNELAAYLNDESGKKENSNILAEFLEVIKNTLAYGESIHGFAIYVSTLGKIDEGGREFFEMCKRSFADDRGDNGQTQTGLVTMFIPAYEGYDGCVDMYGESIIEDPSEPFIPIENYAKGIMEYEKEGAKTKMQKSRDHKRKSKDFAGLSTELRNNPWTLREATRRNASGGGRNTESLTKRVSDIAFTRVPLTRRVRFFWSDGLTLRSGRPHKEGIKVMMEDDPEGKWVISYSAPPHLSNKCRYDQVSESWSPGIETLDRYVMGVDPYKSNEKDASTKVKFLSKGAGVIKWKRDPILDPDTKDMREWESNRVIMHYLNRPETTDEFCEDMLLPCVYYGCMANVERNVDVVITTWTRWKFRSYLMHLYNVVKGTLEPVPGYHASDATHQKGFNLIHDHLNHHVEREVHLPVLEQVVDIETFDDITKNDLFAAWEAAEIGCENSVPADMVSHSENSMKMDNMFHLFD